MLISYVHAWAYTHFLVDNQLSLSGTLLFCNAVFQTHFAMTNGLQATARVDSSMLEPCVNTLWFSQ